MREESQEREREKEKKIKPLLGHKSNTRTEVSILARGARRLTLPAAFKKAGSFQETAEGNQRHPCGCFP